MSDANDENKSSNLLKLFEEAKDFTQKLLKENERLRMVIAGLRNEIRELEGKYVKVDVPRLQERVRLLEDENRALREENRELKGQFSTIERENWEFSERYLEVEKQNSNLINMYVASYRLHSTLDFNQVTAIISEIIVNLIGSEWFGVYIVDEERDRLMQIAYMGPEKQGQASLPIDGVFAQTCSSKTTYVADETAQMEGGGDEPVACIPLKVGDKVMGLIAIYELLIQKDGFKALDHELFELLGVHAATAIYGSHLYTRALRQGTLMAGFAEIAETKDTRNTRS